MLLTENEIDPITRDLLEFDGLSTNLPSLAGKDAINLLFQKKPDSLADLSINRTRLSEAFFMIIYRQIKMAHNKYKNKHNCNFKRFKGKI
jgi:hypothetical protein